MSLDSRVVVTGLGAVTAQGIGIGSLWEGLIDRVNCVGPIQSFDASTLPSSIGAEVAAFKTKDFTPKAYRKSTKLMSRDIELAIAAAHEAALDARLPTRCLIARGEIEGAPVDSTRLGVNIGAGLICPDLEELASAFATALNESGQFDIKKWGSEGMRNLTPLWLLKFLPNMLACHVSIVHDAQSVSNTITCGGASGHLAIGEAFRNIARGAMDVCICGGAECKTNPMGVARAALIGRLVTDGNSDPATACRPFARDRSGTVCAEGAGLVVLESAEHAVKRGARIYAEIVGFGAATSTRDWSTPDPSGEATSLAIRSALRDAQLGVTDIDLIGTFGCGTIAHDESEMRAWRTVLGGDGCDKPALAIKGGLGTCGAGAGAIDLCATVMALHHNTIPPSINTEPVEPDCPFRFAANDPVDCRVTAAVSVAYALSGGQNAAIVIKKFVE